MAKASQGILAFLQRCWRVGSNTLKKKAGIPQDLAQNGAAIGADRAPIGVIRFQEAGYGLAEVISILKSRSLRRSCAVTKGVDL